MLNSIKLLEESYKVTIDYWMHHNIDAYTKSAYQSAYMKYESNLKDCFKNRFRDENDLQRTLFSFDMVMSGNAELRMVSDPRLYRRKLHFLKKVNWESLYSSDYDEKMMNMILKFKPKLFCLNSGVDCSIENKSKTKKFMEAIFPKPSKFEIQ